jgi:hypothetical protein
MRNFIKGLAAALAVCMISACAQKNTMLDTENMGGPEGVARAWIASREEVIQHTGAVVGMEEVASGDMASQSPLTLGAVSNRVKHRTYRVEGVGGTALVNLSLQRKNNGAWKVVDWHLTPE